MSYTRRELLGTGSRLAGGLAAVEIRPLAATGMNGQDQFQSLVDKAWKARDAKDWDRMASYLVAAWHIRHDSRGLDRFGVGEGLYASLTFAQIMACRPNEACDTARACLRAMGRDSNDTNWLGSRLQVAWAAAAVGDYKTSCTCLREIHAREDHVGVLRDRYRDVVDQATHKEFEYSYEFAPLGFAAEFERGLVPAFVPRSDLPYQTATYEVAGARSFVERRKGEQVWLEVVPSGRRSFTVRGKVVQKMVCYWDDIRALQRARCVPLPSEDPYLGESYGVRLSERCREAASGLRGATQWEVTRNTMRWMDANIPYAMDNSDKIVVNSEDALRYRKGVCNPRALLCVALLRANGVPCRVVRGLGSTATPPGWHTWMEIRSPRTDASGRPIWMPTDVGSTLTNFPLHLLIQLYPSVAPFSARAFEWETWYPWDGRPTTYTSKRRFWADTSEAVALRV